MAKVDITWEEQGLLQSMVQLWVETYDVDKDETFESLVDKLRLREYFTREEWGGLK